MVGFIGVDGVIDWSEPRQSKALDASRGGCIPSAKR